nr:PREDICTED: zinc transporter ZIP3 [Bemisia tabaci]
MIRAYLIATAGLGVTCFVAGMLPRLISFQIRSSRSLILSFCLCCGAGVLLATAMVHILPEISEKIPNLAAVVFCAGFLMLFFIDEMVHFWCSSKNGDYEDMDPLLNGTSHHHYGAIPRPIENDLNFSSEESDGSASSSRASHNSPSTTKRKAEKQPSTSSTSTGTSTDDYLSSHCHSGSTSGQVALLAALSLHSLLEGAVIGVQHEPIEILFLTSVVASHKIIVSLCLGMELAAQYCSLKRHLGAILFFIFGSILGIVIGMSVHIQNAVNSNSLYILQGLAGGTLLYVTVCEVLPRERARWQTVQGAGLVQFAAVSTGFGLLVFFNSKC